MTNLDLNKLVALARAHTLFIKGKLGDEYINTMDTHEGKRLAALVISWKTGTMEPDTEILPILVLAGHKR